MFSHFLLLLLSVITSAASEVGNVRVGDHSVSPVPQTAQPRNQNGDGGPALKASLGFPSGIALDSRGNLVIADRRFNRVRQVHPGSGIITTVAGTGERSFAGDGGPATQAKLSIPEYVALDGNDNVYIADRGNSRIRRVDAKSGVITTVAGIGSAGYSGDGGKATAAKLSYPFGLALDHTGNIFIADTENHCIRRVDVASGVITTVAGNGRQGFSGDGGLATKATFYRPHVVAVDPSGDLIIGDSFNQRVRRVDRRTGIVRTIAGTGEEGHDGDGGDALGAKFRYFGALAFDSRRNLLITTFGRIRLIDARTNVISTIAGTGERGFDGDGGPAQKAVFTLAYGMALDKNENIYFADAESGRIRRIDSKTRTIVTVCGGEQP
jgi:trimeric autotransporter adhesin